MQYGKLGFLMQVLTTAVKLFGVGGKDVSKDNTCFDTIKALQQYMDRIFLVNLAL